jgi:hypothetical protein
MMRQTGFAALAAALFLSGFSSAQPASRMARPASGDWWESTPAIMRVFLTERQARGRAFPLDPAAASKRLDELRAAGIHAIEIFAPAEGGNSYSGLDTINRYRLDPKAGTMADFRRLVQLTHEKGMRVITFDNLGYSSVEAVDFLKACDDIRAGRQSREVNFYIWSDAPDAPPPGSAGKLDRYFFVRPDHGPRYNPVKGEFWQYSERAGKYYWTKWGGVDLSGRRVRLPQYNWSSPDFQREAERIIRFWMDTGIDGMIIDAVNWYVGCDWRLSRRHMTDVIASYGRMFSQPEGAGGFHEDPVPWITEGGWTCVQDYGLGIWWEKDNNTIQKAIDTGDPRPIERALRDYHDRVVESGGTLYYYPPRFEDGRKTDLALALVAAAGDMVVLGEGRSPAFPNAEQSRVLKFKQKYPAMHQLSRRRALPTSADGKHYAFLRTAREGGERILAVMNFQAEPQTLEVDLSGVDFATMTDVDSGAAIERQSPWRVELPAYGYRFYVLADQQREAAMKPSRPAGRARPAK